jgi:hypothetical protein
VLESYTWVKYIIKVKLRNLEYILSGQQWYEIPGMPGYAMADFYYRCAEWKQERRFVAIRKATVSKADGALFETIQYEYFCYVSNIYESPLYLHSFYGDRGTSENWIEAVKKQMFAGSILTKHFDANEALWLASIMSYNVSLWMRILTDKKSWHEEPMTFRLWFIQLAGKVVNSGRQVFLKMSKEYYYRERWLELEKKLDLLVFS